MTQMLDLLVTEIIVSISFLEDNYVFEWFAEQEDFALFALVATQDFKESVFIKWSTSGGLRRVERKERENPSPLPSKSAFGTV